ncbi:hypothetical protein ACFXOS_10360, partial [Streptomyces sp. NPDC059175]|uniref:hypothetical protein n=1 Tax=Streptomyces sp. NPDC059175 TaxID=3346757 RepID=UPI0036AC60F4
MTAVAGAGPAGGDHRCPGSEPSPPAPGRERDRGPTGIKHAAPKKKKINKKKKKTQQKKKKKKKQKNQ